MRPMMKKLPPHPAHPPTHPPWQNSLCDLGKWENDACFDSHWTDCVSLCLLFSSLHWSFLLCSGEFLPYNILKVYFTHFFSESFHNIFFFFSECLLVCFLIPTSFPWLRPGSPLTKDLRVPCWPETKFASFTAAINLKIPGESPELSLLPHHYWISSNELRVASNYCF